MTGKKEEYECLIIYGAGVRGKRFYIDNYKKYKKVMVAVTDNTGISDVLGLKVQNLSDLSGYNDSALVVVATGGDIQREMEEYARSIGFRNVSTPQIPDRYDGSYAFDLKKELLYFYAQMMNRLFDIDNPRTFNEKIQWLKVYDSTDLKTELADKYLVRRYVKEKIGEEHLIPLIGSWDKFEDIPFNDLPEKYVLKCNHGSGMNAIVDGSPDLTVLKEKFKKWLDTNYAYCSGFEMHYNNIQRRIIAEEYIEEICGTLLDYKVHCFGGEPKFIQVIGERNPENHTAKQVIYDINWKRKDWCFSDYPEYTYDLERPAVLDELIGCARDLSNGFMYVRVDFYVVEKKVLFGEMTFTPNTGIYAYSDTYTYNTDLSIGDMIDLCQI